MDFIDIILWSTVIISVIAFAVSLSSYYMSLRQSAKEDFLNRFNNVSLVRPSQPKYISSREELIRESNNLKDLP